MSKINALGKLPFFGIFLGSSQISCDPEPTDTLSGRVTAVKIDNVKATRYLSTIITDEWQETYAHCAIKTELKKSRMPVLVVIHWMKIFLTVIKNQSYYSFGWALLVVNPKIRMEAPWSDRC